MKNALIGFAMMTTAIALSAQSAQSSAYKTSTGSTFIHIQELTGGPPVGTGYYFTTIGSLQWKGNFTSPLTASTVGASRVYTGNFTDFRMGSGLQQQCQGTIHLQRPLVLSNLPTPLQAKWTIGAGGISCPSPIGTVTTLNLQEALPVAQNNGNFAPTATHGNTIISDTAGLATWPKWKIVDPDPAGLNCRRYPGNGSVVTTFAFNAIISVLNVPMPNKFIAVSGNPWLSIKNSPVCAVRARNSYIKPVVMPF